MLDIMSKYAPAGFTTTNVDTVSITLKRMVFRHDSLFDAFRKLTDLAGDDYYFYVDENKDLHFTKKGSTSSGVTLDGTNVTRSRFKVDAENIVNRVWVYGAKQLVKVPQESFTADGVGSVFTLDYKPHNTQVQVGGVEKKGGVLNILSTSPSGVDYLVNYEDQGSKVYKLCYIRYLPTGSLVGE